MPLASLTPLGEIGSQLSTRFARYGASALLAVAFGIVTFAVYHSASLLKLRMSDDAAEALQAALFTLFSVAGGAVLIGIWQAAPNVYGALEEIKPSPEAGVKVLITGVAFAVAYTVTRITKRLIRVGDSRDAITNHQREVLHHLLQIFVFLPALIFTLALWNVGGGNLLLSASVLGVVIGFAARQTLGAVLAGFVLLFSRPFEAGDWVEIEDNEGIVTDITIVNTRIKTFDDEVVMLPNDQITDSPVVNRSRNNRLRVRVDVGIDYETDVGRAAQVAADAMDDIDVLMDGPKPDVVVDRFDDSAVVLNLRFWIENPTIQRKWAAQGAVMEAVKEAFEREGISIPFPQRVLAGREGADSLRVAADGTPTTDDGKPTDSAAQRATDGGADSSDEGAEDR